MEKSEPALLDMILEGVLSVIVKNRDLRGVDKTVWGTIVNCINKDGKE